MRHKLAKPDRTVAEIAARQHGVVNRKQLSWAGLSPKAISRRVQAGRLHRLYRGVYAVGHTNLSREGRWLAAVFACGEGAVLSHENAAHLLGISPTSPSTIHVTVPATSGRTKRRGIRLHYSTTLTPADTTQRHNIPVTTHARTLADLGYGTERTRSDLERLFLRICREHGIPKPEVNVKIGSYTVDFLWRQAGLVVEVDGYRYHSDRATFRSDRARDRELGRRGLEVLRFADEEVGEEPDAVADSVLTGLRAAAMRGSQR
jgi:very-short-patch-repair endonuclease